MKKTIAVIMLILLTGCGSAEPKAVNTYEPEFGSNVIVEYTEMSDGTWQSGGRTYDFRLELTGRAPDAEFESTIVVLTNNSLMTYDQALKNLESSAPDSTAVVVELK